jgi:hypothetical protein
LGQIDSFTIEFLTFTFAFSVFFILKTTFFISNFRSSFLFGGFCSRTEYFWLWCRLRNNWGRLGGRAWNDRLRWLGRLLLRNLVLRLHGYSIA